jgi:HEAT repeat protein
VDGESKVRVVTTLIRVALCIALSVTALASELPDTQQLRALCRDVEGPDRRRQQKAVGSLRQLPPGAVASLAALLNSESEDSEIRAGAAIALGTFGAPARRYVPDLAKALDGDSIPLSQAAAGALSGLVNRGDAAVVPDLVKWLVKRRPDCSFECFWAITALGKIGPSARSALPVLGQIAKDGRMPSDIQAEARASVKKIGARASP